MKNILIPLAPILLIASPACLAPTDDLTQEPVVEATAAVVSGRVTGVVAGGASGLSSAAYGAWIVKHWPHICGSE